jgi:hypothetical protein
MHGRPQELQELSQDQMKKVVLDRHRYVPLGRWTAVTLPSGKSSAIDSHLRSPDYLRTVVIRAPDFPRLILQADASGGVLLQNRSLRCVFTAIGTALANAARWPGSRSGRPAAIRSAFSS